MRSVMKLENESITLHEVDSLISYLRDDDNPELFDFSGNLVNKEDTIKELLKMREAFVQHILLYLGFGVGEEEIR